MVEYIDKLQEVTIMDKVFIETDFWKDHGSIITEGIDRLKQFLYNEDEELCGNFNVLLSQLWGDIFEKLVEEADSATEVDDKHYTMLELQFIQKKLADIKIDSFYNEGIDKCKLNTEENWKKCSEFITDRFDGTVKYIPGP